MANIGAIVRVAPLEVALLIVVLGTHVAVVPTGGATLTLAIDPWPVRTVTLDGTLAGHRPP
eukprot:6133344-Alexandrium_andersonii.AAC.1